MFLAWHTAAFQRSKRLPSWESVRRRITRRAPSQSTDDMLAMVKHLNRAFGGRDLTSGEEA